MPQEITNLTQLTGVGVAGLSVFLIYKLTANHIFHLTEAINKLTEVIIRLEEWLKENHDKT